MPTGQCLGHTAHRQEGAQRRETAAQPPSAREASAPGWSRTSAPAVSEQCSPLSYGRPEPPAGIEPALRPYKGRVLAVDTTEAGSGDGRSRTCAASLQARCSTTRASSPRECGRMESNHHSAGHQGYSLGSSPMLSVRKRGWPIGFEPTLRGSRPRVLPLHHSHHGRGRPGSNRRPLA
jgi:hypothetical protein